MNLQKQTLIVNMVADVDGMGAHARSTNPGKQLAGRGLYACFIQ